MRNTTNILLFTATAVFAQQAWNELSISAPTGNGNRFTATGIHANKVAVVRVISRAYSVPEHRIVGPAWLATEQYAITAEAPDRESFQPMFQKELANWFHLLVHRETRVIPVFVLKRAEGQPSPAAPAKGQPAFQMPQTDIASFANRLADVVHIPVINETDLEGKFDIRLNYEVGNIGSLRTAVKHQLGFQLVDDKRPIDLLIVDYAEKAQLR
jgi:uncharacterized protein (TIGR03435 family)